MKKFQVIIIGGGASGMFCALRLSDLGIKDVAVIERNDRLGRKLSATGNGQGNISNEDMSSAKFLSSTGDAKTVLRRFGKEALLQYMSNLGGLFNADETGRIYPASRQASSVTDLLRFALTDRGIAACLGEKAEFAEKRGAFIVRTQKEEYLADFLVLACGGKASPHFGTDGYGYALAKSFGHTVTDLSPSLVRLRTDPALIRGLKGIRTDCRVSLKKENGSKNRTLFSQEQRGDVLFTDNGVSGDAIFRMSAFAETGDFLYLDFLPEIGAGSVAEAIRHKIAMYPDMRAEDVLRCIVNSAIGRAVLRRCCIAMDGKAKDVSHRSKYLADTIKGYMLPVKGTDGFENAQVTKGGVPMYELEDDLESKFTENLYIIGELADIDGECGGYNLQWAFSSGAVAAEGIAGRGSACR